MTPQDKAKDLVDSFRIILMNEDTDCGNEILCTIISKKCAKIAVEEIIKEIRNIEFNHELNLQSTLDYFTIALIEIDKL